MSVFLAHGTGIDDVAVFVVVTGLAIVVLRASERKARRRAETEAADGKEPLSSGPDE